MVPSYPVADTISNKKGTVWRNIIYAGDGGIGGNGLELSITSVLPKRSRRRSSNNTYADSTVIREGFTDSTVIREGFADSNKESNIKNNNLPIGSTVKTEYSSPRFTR